MIPDLVVFDCDGVLVDTEGPIFQAIAASLSRYGLPMDPDKGRDEFTGSTMSGLRDKAIAKGAKLPAHWLDEVQDDIHAQIAKGVRTFDGAVDLIAELEDAGVPVYVASNGSMKRMSISLAPSGLWDRLKGRIMSCETYPAKPDPAMILHAMSQTNADPQRTFMIDDSVPGCQAGLAAKVRTIGFATEGQDATLRASGAEVAQSMTDVRARFLG